MMFEMHAIVHGRVQGVFFRDTTSQWASELGITGTVKNLSDGTVEIYAHGERLILEQLVERLSSETGPGHVISVDTVYREANQVYDGFQVIY